ncbi:alanine aminotransferase 2-like isoform X2 [Triplophysa dalaica]|uniref:alanine aminotransferase 2-like isoform X2 n=1 Tax=Triplophysa dalaica TaxID=1582913 RepID=UPI0024DF9D15|nr:alanine aminotransferase 2-like isoform X2 [Triplophysa dalaica]
MSAVRKTTRQPSPDEELHEHAEIISHQLKQGLSMSRSFNKVLDVSSGNIHSAGVKPITFIRQVLAGCLYPSLLDGDDFPPDVRSRAQTLLSQCDGNSIDSSGLAYVRSNVAKFISLRDGGIPSSPEHIFITCGSQRGLMSVMRLLCQSEGRSAVLIPDPTPHTLTRILETVGLVPLPYRLQEQGGWSLERAELKRVIKTSRTHCCPRAIYINNPGNPTGHIQSRESIETVIRFAAEENLFLLVDEIYQNTVWVKDKEFVSYKRVLVEMGNPYHDRVQLASFHSLSNGIMGECGLRAGYMELVNVDEGLLLYTEVLLTGDINTPVIGQIALDVMVDPPRPGDASYDLYIQEVSYRLSTLRLNISSAVDFMNDLSGFTCSTVQSGIYIYPHLSLPHTAHTQIAGLCYCRRLLEDQGVCVGFNDCKKEDHTDSHNCFHLRLCVMMSSDDLEDFLCRLQTFHLQFLKEKN